MHKTSNLTNIFFVPLLLVMGPVMMLPFAADPEMPRAIRMIAWTCMGLPFGAAAITTAYLIREYLHGFQAIRNGDGNLQLPWGVFDYSLMLVLPTFSMMFAMAMADPVIEPLLASVCCLGGSYGMITVLNVILRKALVENEEIDQAGN